jgi:two-component system chemotaxis response regulator CheB
MEIVERLPQDLPAAILVVIRTRTESDSLLPEILGRASTLPAAFAVNGEPLRPGRIYVAPPDFHLLVSGWHVRLNRGPRENGFRPAVDPLFRSAARHHGAGVMGVILSGALDDGSYGLKVLKESGGVAVVQDPGEATFPSMPANAIRVVDVDQVAPAGEIADLIVTWAATPTSGERVMARKNEPESQNAAESTNVQEMEEEFGSPSGLTCPECGGALWEIQDGELIRYRCHVGHQLSIEGLDAEQQNAVENALWSAIRVLEEHADLRNRMARRAEAGGMQTVSEAFSRSARDSEQQAHTIRELLFSRAEPSPIPLAEFEAAKSVKLSTNGRGRKTARRKAAVR